MKVTLIIPTYNEVGIEDKIIKLTDELRSFDYEIIIVEGFDSPIPPVEEIKTPFKGLKGIYHIKYPKGRGIQLAKGVNLAEGELLIFLHADTAFTRNQLEDIFENWEDFDYGAFRLKIDGGGLLYRLIEFFVYLRSRIFKLPYGDQTIFIKSDKLKKIGSIKPLPLFEDVELMIRCKKEDLRFYLSKYHSITSNRRWQKNGVLKTSVKNLSLLILYLAGVKVEKLYRLYYNNR
ncbi:MULTISPECIES: TIGR04283 family arsenosugar biosynthesis glycosyltransferase [Calditerrivibrio]|uniref:TIGR04283 family arsenosugar biosynthesis glycosyltransferase n=1 Tax=Calditerrivibrio TaxID=545865 RepID=UPI003C73E84B